MEHLFRIGDEVSWTSGAGGHFRSKKGRIVEVVPAGKFPRSKLDGPGGYRDHESYVVEVQKVRSRPKLYWPRVAYLKPAS